MIVRILMIAAAMGALGLAGCGKKGPLEPPKAHAAPAR
jgi:predicted small lipoprotein YifL